MWSYFETLPYLSKRKRKVLILMNIIQLLTPISLTWISNQWISYFKWTHPFYILFCLRRFHGLVNLVSIWSLTIKLYDFVSKRTSFNNLLKKSLFPCSKVNVTFENIIYCCKCSPKLLSATQCCFNVPLVQNHFEIN